LVSRDCDAYLCFLAHSIETMVVSLS